MNSQKIKSILTSKITVGLTCFVLGWGVLGGTTSGVDITKDRYNQLLEFEKVALNKEDSSEGTNGEKASEDSDNIKTIGEENSTYDSKLGLGETFYLKKDNGVKLMSITINSAKLISQRNQFSEKQANKVVEIEYTYENLGYDKNLYIFDSNFKVYDASGNILESYPVGENKFPQSISRGKKCTANMVFAFNDESNNLEIEFYENIFNDISDEVFNIVVE